MPAVYINPKTDFAFKKIFGSTESKDILISFLNAILKAKQDGLQQGIQQGRQEGEKMKALEIARQLLDVLNEETISQKTGLTVAEIQALRLP
jgi:flagellar biosynthesis/type III secretory pathway protein FliH